MIFKLKKHIKRLRARVRVSLDRNGPAGGKGVRILMYHSVGGRSEDHRLAIRVPAQRFSEELDYIVDSGYRTFTVSEFVRGEVQGSTDKAVVITFDDGYKDNIAIAAAELKKRGLRATFFVTTSYIDQTVRKCWADGRLREFMTWEDVADLSRMGFEIGSHMAHHINLATLADEAVRSELQDSEDAISRCIGKAVQVFSYPYGGANERIGAIAKACGYKAGCSSFCGWNTPSTNLYLLKRTEIDAYDIISDLRFKLSGYYD